MEKFCPITTKLVDENISRLNGIWTVTLTLAYLFSGFLPLLVFLVFDFAIRALIDSKYSYLSAINRYIASVLRIERKPINAGPKIFASQVGLILSVTATIGALLDITALAIAPAAVLAFFSFLEGALGYCVACKLYPIFQNILR